MNNTELMPLILAGDGYQLTIADEAIIRNGYVQELERERDEAREQRDKLAKLHNKNAIYFNELLELCRTLRKEQDRLAEALRKAISWGDSASHHILHRQNINWTYLNEAREALQSLTK